MSEVETETELEISPEDARQDAIRDMMDKWANGELTDAQDSFNSIMNVRADTLVADKKSEIAAAIYNDAIETDVAYADDGNDESQVEVEDDELPETESEEPQEAEGTDEEI